MKKYPQRMVNVPVRQRIDLENCAPVQNAVRDVEARMNGRGRVLLRPSGTEPLIRVMVEGEDAALVHEQVDVLVSVVEQVVAGQSEAV
jgi:phosphoglucosamine mutase